MMSQTKLSNAPWPWTSSAFGWDSSFPEIAIESFVNYYPAFSIGNPFADAEILVSSHLHRYFVRTNLKLWANLMLADEMEIGSIHLTSLICSSTVVAAVNCPLSLMDTEMSLRSLCWLGHLPSLSLSLRSSSVYSMCSILWPRLILYRCFPGVVTAEHALLSRRFHFVAAYRFSNFARIIQIWKSRSPTSTYKRHLHLQRNSTSAAPLSCSASSSNCWSSWPVENPGSSHTSFLNHCVDNCRLCSWSYFEFWFGLIKKFKL